MSNLDILTASTPEPLALTFRQEANGKMETKEGKDRVSLLVHAGAAISLSVGERGPGKVRRSPDENTVYSKYSKST